MPACLFASEYPITTIWRSPRAARCRRYAGSLCNPRSTSPALSSELDRFQQRRHVEGALAGALVGDIGPARKQQHREHVFRAFGPADDIFADGAVAELVARVRDGIEHPQSATPGRIERRGRDLDRAPVDPAVARSRSAGASVGHSGIPRPWAITSS